MRVERLQHQGRVVLSASCCGSGPSVLHAARFTAFPYIMRNMSRSRNDGALVGPQFLPHRRNHPHELVNHFNVLIFRRVLLYLPVGARTAWIRAFTARKLC